MVRYYQLVVRKKQTGVFVINTQFVSVIAVYSFLFNPLSLYGNVVVIGFNSMPLVWIKPRLIVESIDRRIHGRTCTSGEGGVCVCEGGEMGTWRPPPSRRMRACVYRYRRVAQSDAI